MAEIERQKWVFREIHVENIQNDYIIFCGYLGRLKNNAFRMKNVVQTVQ